MPKQEKIDNYNEDSEETPEQQAISEQLKKMANNESSDEGLLQEKKDWKEELEQREGEPYEVFEVRNLLKVLAKGVEEGYVTSPENVEYLVKRVEELRSQGVDLSTIQGLDKEIEQLREEAPLTAIESSIKIMDSLRGREREENLASWYYHVEDTLDKSKDSLDENWIERVRKKLKKIRKELELD